MKKCNMCGSQLQDSYNACPNCGNTNLTFEQPMQNMVQPMNGQQYGQYQQPMPNQQPFYGAQQMQSDPLLQCFVGANYDKISSGKFNFCALLLSPAYLLYRKQWLPGIVIYTINILVRMFVPSFSLLMWALWIFLGVKFNSLYMDYAKKEVDKVRQSNPGADMNYLAMICSKNGGTSIWGMIGVLLLVAFSVSMIISALVY